MKTHNFNDSMQVGKGGEETVRRYLEGRPNVRTYEDVSDDEALGEYYADCCCIFAGVPDHIQRYFDFESYGRDIRLESNCCFTSYGVVIDNR